jgi:biotin carboxyl carrier protein
MKIRVNGRHTFVADVTKAIPEIDGAPVDADIRQTGPGTFHILSGNRSFRASVMEWNAVDRKYVLAINNTSYRLEITDRYSELLARLGMDGAASSRVAGLKAPMPGLVLNVFVKEGDAVKKNDSLVTLEAMKMENILRSPGDGIVKSVNVQLGGKVEKGQVLIRFV